MPKVGKKTRTLNKKIPKKMVCQNLECTKAGKEQSSINFYNTKSSLMPKYPLCKECVNKSIVPNDLQTVYKVLKDMNIGFIKNIWEKAYESNPDSVFPNYMRMINSLPQYEDIKWSDSQFEYENNYSIDSDGMIYSTEWVGTYSQADLNYLEEYLKSLKKDFKIITRNHIDYARKIAKASLAMDKAYEEMVNGGSDARYKTMKSIFDDLSKSAQFAESQRGVNDISLGCFGIVFDKVEKNIYVTEHQPNNKDIYDNLLEQFSNINKSL